MKVNDDVRKVMMAGIGAMSALAEKTQETVDSLAQKGEEALDKGQVLNERLRRTIQKAVRDEAPEPKPGKDEILEVLERLSPEDRKEIKEKLKSLKQDDE